MEEDQGNSREENVNINGIFIRQNVKIPIKIVITPDFIEKGPNVYIENNHHIFLNYL